MARYLFYTGYDGAAYHGWQVQPNGNSVQAELERALSLVLRRETPVTGAGRTDAGVHARRMGAHFDAGEGLDTAQLVYRLNRILPRDIVVHEMMPVDEAFHARFSARSRTYHYYIHTERDPFVRDYSCELHYPLDFPLMNEAAARLLEVTDFAAFCKSHTDVKTTLCDVTEARWERLSEEGDRVGRWCFVITANRFLRNMVRAVVGTLIEVGRHRMSLEEFSAVISGGNRQLAGESMPACALFLWEVEY